MTTPEHDPDDVVDAEILPADPEQPVMLLVADYRGPISSGGLLGIYVNTPAGMARAEEHARAIEGIVAWAPIVRDYRPATTGQSSA